MYTVIMAGGSGTRFWPLSRESMPKQLLKICGDDTLIQQTVGRILPLVERERILIVTNRNLAGHMAMQLTAKFGGSWDVNFILEPDAKNTAPALALAALHLERSDPESIMVVLSADHFIRKSDVFLDYLTKAEVVAAQGYLVTLGIAPHRPETGYGYIKAGEKITTEGMTHGEMDVCKVEAFVEKPDIETAREYLKLGNYYWNAGIFIWKTKTLLNEIAKYHVALHQAVEGIRRAIGTDQESEAITEAFRRLSPISIDYAVMEKTGLAAVIPADIGWSDVGSWSALDEVSERDGSTWIGSPPRS
jgi:mannose-1-phosphate guanylyltransferase/mannose-6-phosphate isomerase